MARIGKEKKEEIKNKIIQESKALFFEKGYDKTSTSQIAKAVEIAEGTIFNYFATKAEIFFEVFSSEFPIENINPKSYIDKEAGVADIIYNFFYKNLKPVIILPKMLLRELGIASLNIMKKRPMLFKKLADLDYKMLDKLHDLIEELQINGLINTCNSESLSEIIYSILMFEILIYSYEDDRSKETMLKNFKEKIVFILKGYI